MKLLVKKLSTVLLAVVTAVALTLSMSLYVPPVFADDDGLEKEVYSAIDILPQGDENAPLYNDGKKSFEITLDSSASDWGKEGTDWELDVDVTAASYFDEDAWKDVTLSPNTGDYYYDTKTRKLTLNGSKIWKKVSRVTDDTFFLVKIVATAVAPDEDGESFIELDRAELDIEESDTLELYDFDLESLDKTFLPTMENYISKTGEVYVADSKHPYGEELTYTVTSVTSSNNSVVSVEKAGSDWIYTTLKQGSSTLTVYYKSYNGEKQSYQIKVSVRNNMYEVTIDPLNGYQGLPGWEAHLEAKVTHTYLDENDSVVAEENPAGIEYAWSIYEASEPFVDHYDFSDDAHIMNITTSNDPRINFQDIEVFINIQKDGKVLCSSSDAIYITSKYTELTPTQEDLGDSFNIGDTIPVDLQVKEYTLEHPTGKIVENASYEWSYDKDVVEITGSGSSYNIKRLASDGVEIILLAEWTDEIGDAEADLQFYDFDPVSTDLEDYTLYFDDQSGYERPDYELARDGSLSLDDLNIEVCYGDEVLSPDKYDFEVYSNFFDGDKEYNDPVADVNHLNFACNQRYSELIGQQAAYCDFVVVAKAKENSGYTGKTDMYQGFRIYYPGSLDYDVPTIEVNDDYWAVNFDSWHDYYEIPSDKVAGINPVVKDHEGNILSGLDYVITYYKWDKNYTCIDGSDRFPTENGHYFAKVEGMSSYYYGITFFDFAIGSDNPVTFTSKTKTLKVKKLKKKALTVAPITVKNKKGTITYEKIYGSSKLTINKKTGKVKVKKKTKKGTYTMDVLVRDSGNTNFFPKFDVVTVKIKVKK